MPFDYSSSPNWAALGRATGREELTAFSARSQPQSHSQLPGALFHEQWWLDAASGGRFQEVTATSGGRTVGRLPFVMRRRMGFVECRMPSFTHVLGPVVDSGAGKPQTQLLRRLSIIRTLIDQLPPFDFFVQAVDSSIADGLAFQDRGYNVSPQYTLEIDCRNDMKSLWDGMHTKTRQHIRRAEEKFTISVVDDAAEFVRFYLGNLKKRGSASSINFETFPGLYLQSRERESGEILSARWPDGRATAMTYIVWGQGRMYYLLSTRADDPGDNGSVNLLIWSAIKRAHDRNLVLDLDGISTSGTARFLSGFNGSLKLRMVVRQNRFAYGVMQYAKRRMFGFPDRETCTFT